MMDEGEEEEEEDDFTGEREPVLGGAYGDLDDQTDEPMRLADFTTPKPPIKTPGHWQPGKRGRPPLSHSQKK